MVIVGLAPAVKHDLFKNRPEAHLYLPSGAADSTRMFVYARAAAPQTGDAIVTSVREQLRAADANLPVTFVKSFRAQHEGSAQVWVLRAAAKMFLTLGLAGTFVAVIGLVRRAQLPGLAPHPGVRRAHGDRRVARRRAGAVFGRASRPPPPDSRLGWASPCCWAGDCVRLFTRLARRSGDSGSRQRDSC